MVVWSARWRAWCLVMDGEGRRRRATCVDDGGYVEGCGSRIWTEFPLAEFAEILSRKAVKFCIYSINYVGIVKPLWYTWLSTHCYYCECNLKVEGSIPVGALFLYYIIITTIVTNYWFYWTTYTRKFLLDSYWIPTGFLLDSYWTPCTGLQYTHSLGIRNS